MKKGNINIIVDPNIFISAALTKKTRRFVFTLLTDKRFTIYSCKELNDEFLQVIVRSKFRKYITKTQVDRFYNWAASHCVVIVIQTFIRLCRDDNDNYLLSLCFDSHSDYLITGDSDLLVLKEFAGTSI